MEYHCLKKIGYSFLFVLIVTTFTSLSTYTSITPMTRSYKPFAITAKTLGSPRLLYTRILVVNLASEDKLTAAYVNALWDTGAQCSLMTRDLARRLGFDFEKEIPGIGIGGITTAAYGYAYVALVSNGDTVDTMAAVVDSLPGKHCSFILGMDFISKGSLAISSSRLETTLSFTIPAGQPIDFVKDLESEGIATKYIPLSSGKEDTRVYSGHEVLGLILPEKAE